MKQLVLFLAAVPLLALPAFGDVAVLTAYDPFTFETTICVTPSMCPLFNEVGEEFELDDQGNIIGTTDLGDTLSGPFTLGLDSQDAILPPGSIVTGGTFTVDVASSPSGTPGFDLIGDSTINSLNIAISCDGAPPVSFNFTSPDAKTMTGSFTPCSGQDIFVDPVVSGNASLAGVGINPFPTAPGDHTYLGTLTQTFTYTVDLDYTVPGEAPEPSEVIPTGLVGGFLFLLAKRRQLTGKAYD
jgi:hypothetical protein